MSTSRISLHIHRFSVNALLKIFTVEETPLVTLKNCLHISDFTDGPSSDSLTRICFPLPVKRQNVNKKMFDLPWDMNLDLLGDCSGLENEVARCFPFRASDVCEEVRLLFQPKARR